MTPNKPKPAFYIAILAVIVALVGLGLWRCSGGKKKATPKIDPNVLKGSGSAAIPAPGTAEAPNGAGITQVED